MYQSLPFFCRRRAIMEMRIARDAFWCVKNGAYRRADHIYSARQAILRARHERLST